MARRTEYITPESIDAYAISAIATVCNRWHGHVVIPTPRPLSDLEIRELNSQLRSSNVVCQRDVRASQLAVLFVELQPTYTAAR